MFEKLEEVVDRYNQVHLKLQEPNIVNNHNEYKQLMKEFSDLEKIVKVYQEYKSKREELKSSKLLLESERDEEFRQMIKEEIHIIEPVLEDLNNQIKVLLLPKDPNDDRNVILEIRAGAGGDEASLFAEDLFGAYANYAVSKGWKLEVLSLSEGNVGGYKEVCINISGEKVYSLMKYESGVHRVQRVPKTETQGRIHTSTITVAVLPEADAVELKIDPHELRIDVCRASGAGGQHINTTDSAVRITHIPSGTMVYCQEGKSQHANRDRALKILYSRLLAAEEEKMRKQASDARLSQIGTGDRSERIRTYNYPQTRISDHRIGFTTHALNEIMAGDLDQIIEPVSAYFQSEALQSHEL